ncbi:MAG: hypothetical protein WHS43_06525 [Aquificaceae bacterium]|jgi:hypothetical protein|uniref:hypothetical protein n=1 Tax=Hydrogenobacter sp. Uz 6-8 TaxID=3384828 RepID=UPI0030AE669B
MRKFAGIELSKAGLDVLLSSGERYFFKTIDEFLVSPYSNIESAVAIARDLLIVRKWKLPKEAENNIKEAISLNADDIFPYNIEEIEFLYQIIDHDNNIEVIIIAVEKTLIESIRRIKKVKLITPSAYIYPVIDAEESFTIKRRNYSEVVKFKHGQLIDWFIRNGIEEGIEIDTAKLLIDVLKRNYVPKLTYLDRRLIFNKSHVAYAAFVSAITLFTLMVSVGNFIYWKYKIANVEGKLKETENLVAEYTMLNDRLSSSKHIVEKVSGIKTLELISLMAKMLPKDSWIIGLSIKKSEISIMGETTDAQTLESKFRQSFRNIEFQVRNKTGNVYEYTINIKAGKI